MKACLQKSAILRHLALICFASFTLSACAQVDQPPQSTAKPVLQAQAPAPGMPQTAPRPQEPSNYPLPAASTKPTAPISIPAPAITPCPEKRAQICTAQHKPVCAQRDTGIRCVRAPCPSQEGKTYSNACTACRDEKVLGYVDGACEGGNPASK